MLRVGGVNLHPVSLLRTVVLVSVLLMNVAVAEQRQMPGVENQARAEVNYMLNCQGCHGPKGAGVKGGVVPIMQNFVGNFLHVEGGREFLVRVPGSANSALADDALAELLNWILWKQSSMQLPDPFEPYTAAEVASYRQQPLTDVAAEREDLIERMSAELAHGSGPE